MRLLLIRHGQTPSNVSGALDTAAPGAGLTELGQRQAQALPGALAAENIAGVYVSGLVRTHETAAPLAASLGVEVGVHEGLNEIPAGDLEMKTDRESVVAYIDCAESWARGDLDVALPGGEDGHAFRNRYEGALTEIAQRHGADATVAVISHGAAIRVYAAISSQLGEPGIDDFSLLNTGMVTLSGYPGDGWTILDWVPHPIGGAHLSGDSHHDVTSDPDATPLES